MCFTTFSGKAGELIDRGDNTYGGKFVVNPSGGLISKGHPLGATGMFDSGVYLQTLPNNPQSGHQVACVSQ